MAYNRGILVTLLDADIRFSRRITGPCKMEKDMEDATIHLFEGD